MSRIYKEVTSDHGYAEQCGASDNYAAYIITSAYGHDLVSDYVKKYERVPSSRWYNRHFRFKRIL